MTAIDRAFIKAYSSRRAARGGSASAAVGQSVSRRAEGTPGPGTPSYRIDGPHAAALPHTVALHTKPGSAKSRRPSEENGEQATARLGCRGEQPIRPRRASRRFAGRIGATSRLDLGATAAPGLCRRGLDGRACPERCSRDAAGGHGPSRRNYPRRSRPRPRAFRPRYCRSACHRPSTRGRRSCSQRLLCRASRSPLHRCSRARCHCSRWGRELKNGCNLRWKSTSFSGRQRSPS